MTDDLKERLDSASSGRRNCLHGQALAYITELEAALKKQGEASDEQLRVLVNQMAKQFKRIAELEAALTPLPDAELDALVAQARTGIQTKTMTMQEGETVDLVATFNLQNRLADAITALRARPAGVTVKPGEIECAVWSAMIWAASNNAGFEGVPEYTDRGNSFAEDEARRAAARIRAALTPNTAQEEG